MKSKPFNSKELEEIKSIKVGKWDIISEYHRIDWLKAGHSEEEAKIHGIVIAVVGYQARLGKQTQKYKFELNAYIWYNFYACNSYMLASHLCIKHKSLVPVENP